MNIRLEQLKDYREVENLWNRENAIHHKSPQNIPNIWCFSQLFVFLQRLTDIT